MDVFNALSFQLQNQMTKDKNTLPNPVDLGTKTAQIDSMTACRDQSRVSNKSIKDISSQIQNLMRDNSSNQALICGMVG